MDIVVLRAQYGTRLAFMDGLDRLAVHANHAMNGCSALMLVAPGQRGAEASVRPDWAANDLIIRRQTL